VNVYIPFYPVVWSFCNYNLNLWGCPLFHYLTQWSKVLLEAKLIVTQLGKKFPTFYGTWRFITVFMRSHHRSILSQMYPVHTVPPYFTSNIFPSMPRFSEFSLPFMFSHVPCMLHVPLILPFLITLVIFDEVDKLWSSSLFCSPISLPLLISHKGFVRTHSCPIFCGALMSSAKIPL